MSTIPGYNPTSNTPPAQLGDAPVDPTTQDATAQAASDLGLLAYLAGKYADVTDPTQKAAILAEFNKIMALFSVDASGNVSFTYTDAAGNTETIQIPNNTTNAAVVTAIQTMKSSYSTIAQYSTFANSLTNNPLLAVYEWFEATNFSFKNCANDNTRDAALFFMMSLAGSPVGDLSGDVDEFLGQGVDANAILDQPIVLAQTILAILATKNDPTFTAAIEGCLSVTTKDTAYNDLEAAFAQIQTECPNWQEFYAGTEHGWLDFESRFWPYIQPGSSNGEGPSKANAVPLSSRFLNDNSVLTDMHKNDTSGVSAAPKQLARG